MLTRALEGSGIAQVPLVAEHACLSCHLLGRSGGGGTDADGRPERGDDELVHEALADENGVAATGAAAMQDEQQAEGVMTVRTGAGSAAREAMEEDGAASAADSVL
jgi:mono/diheme cytochrome c family protein